MTSLVAGLIGGAAGTLVSQIPGVGNLANGITGALNSLFGGANLRSIGGIVAPCTIEEHHIDTLTITDHPVELGAQITDHAFLNPVAVDIVVGWGSGTFVPINQIYQSLLNLQKSRVPFDIVTGKRMYTNMLIESIEETTDADTENVLRASLRCRQIIIVSTSVKSLSDPSNQADPSATAQTQNVGTVQAFPVAPPTSFPQPPVTPLPPV